MRLFYNNYRHAEQLLAAAAVCPSADATNMMTTSSTTPTSVNVNVNVNYYPHLNQIRFAARHVWQQPIAAVLR